MRYWSRQKVFRGAVLAISCLVGVSLVPSVGTAQHQHEITQLRVSANRRYLVDQSGVPFLLQGDAAWSLIVALNDTEVEQ